jgi:hypothetical protein
MIHAIDTPRGPYYTDGTVIVPRVSRVLDALYGPYQGGNSRAARDWGTRFHQHAASLFSGHEPRVEDDVLPYMEDFKQKAKEYEIEPIAVEQPSIHPVFLYGGCPDLKGWIRWDGRRIKALLDYKRGVMSRRYLTQIEAYHNLPGYDDVQVCLIWQVMLNKFTLVPEMPDDWNAFVSMLNVLRWRDANHVSV